MKRSLLAVLCAATMFTSCLGPNRAHDSIRNWNTEVAEADWLNEVIFLGLTIIPVYPLAYLGDVVIFNTMGYWGTNPLSDPGPYPDGFHSGSSDDE